jgi:TctA family transporter
LDQKMSRKLLAALAAYAALALLAWFTLDASIPLGGRELPLRAVTLTLVGLFAVRTLLHAQRERVEQDRDRSEHIG